MSKKRLTEMTVTNTKAPPKGGKRIEMWDTALPGFGLRITPQPHDARSYFVMTMAGDGEIVRDDDGKIVSGRRLRRFTIGNARVLPLDEARQRAREILRRAEAGEDDPAHPGVTVPTFRSFVADYLERRRGSWRPSTYATQTRILGHLNTRWGDRPINKIRQQDVQALIDDTAARAPIQANRQLSALKALCADALRRGAIDASPVALMRPPSKERVRERALSDAEIALFWSAASEIGGTFGLAFKLLLVTGQRRSMVRLMSWDELDLQRKVWTVAGSKMKAGKEHQVALSDLAMEILAEAKSVATSLGRPTDRGYVFSRSAKYDPIAGFAWVKTRMDQLMNKTAGKPLATWRLHDLRRTMTHGLAQLGFPPHVADRILAHSQGTIRGVAAVYNQYQYLDERRDALAAWGRKIEEIIGRQPSNVTVLTAKR
jgi:integrase